MISTRNLAITATAVIALTLALLFAYSAVTYAQTETPTVTPESATVPADDGSSDDGTTDDADRDDDCPLKDAGESPDDASAESTT